MDQNYNMDVDDLFGDSEHVNLQTINPIPPVKGLASRVDELSTTGCCQKISWSKNGCVAYISPDGYSVRLKVFSRDTETGKWDLGKDVPIQFPPGRDDFSYVHISWSHLGNDLAIMDAAGHVIIFSCAMALDRMTFIKAELAQPEAEVDAVVGMHWLAILPYEQKNHIAWSASRSGEKWQWNIGSHVFRDAHHPVEGKASLIYLKRHGELKLRFQQHDNSWQESSAQLGPMLSTREPFTHAAFASNNDNTLLLAAYNVSGQLHLYRIEATWNIPGVKHGHATKQFDKPDLQVSEITIEDQCYPFTTSLNSELNGDSESKVGAAARLTHLSFLPVTPEQDDMTLPTIQAIFEKPPNIVSFDQMHPQENPHSVIVRWQVQQSQQNQLHSSLDQVTSKKKSVGSVPARTVFLVTRLPDIDLTSIVLSFYPLWYNMILAFCYNDGTIEFRKRSTMDVMYADSNTETVTTLLQAGFAFGASEPALHVALSPNHCMAACMQQDGTIKLRSMEYQHGTLSTDDDDPKHSAALAALILQSSSAANQYFCSDDLFCILGTLTEKRKCDFISLLFEGLQVNLDCGIDDSSNNHLILLGRSPFFVKTLSATHLLGLKGPVDRCLSSKMAWIVLNIKYVTQILTTIARMHGQIEKTPLRPEVVPQFIGICRWIMHFMVYMIDDLFTLARELQSFQPNQLTRDVLEKKIHELNKPVLLILLSSFPRMMMKLWAQPIAWVLRTAFTYINGTQTPEIRKLYTPLHQALSEIPYDWRLFEALLSEAQSLVRGTYKKFNMNEVQRNHAERDLMLGKLPDVFVPAARRLVTETLWSDNPQQGCLAEKLDIGRVMFFDTTWLGFQESNRARDWHGTHVVDVCQKMIIRGIGTQSHPSTSNTSQSSRGRSDSVDTQVMSAGGASTANVGADEKKKRQLRRCVRCGAYMEDVMHGLPGYTNHHISWLMGVAKHCICGNSWMLAEEKEGAR